MHGFGSRLIAALALSLCVACASLPKLPVGVPLLIVWAYTSTDSGPTALREILVIDKLGADGWVLAHNTGDPTPWWCRLSNAVAITPYAAPVPKPEPESYRAEH